MRALLAAVVLAGSAGVVAAAPTMHIDSSWRVCYSTDEAWRGPGYTDQEYVGYQTPALHLWEVGAWADADGAYVRAQSWAQDYSYVSDDLVLADSFVTATTFGAIPSGVESDEVTAQAIAADIVQVQFHLTETVRARVHVEYDTWGTTHADRSTQLALIENWSIFHVDVHASGDSSGTATTYKYLRPGNYFASFWTQASIYLDRHTPHAAVEDAWVDLHGDLQVSCIADVNLDHVVDSIDQDLFFNGLSDPSFDNDIDGDGAKTWTDLVLFVQAYDSGIC